ncbi:hypothetical protein HDF18_02870 [Mucilaginibacter sp. X5P1]|uniref:hypothetical protein n=1 Tax=Mucilaginibacter sp. X5P1 TaxID=2723088 RepID=UPI001616E9BF|nr:hypothetical protein [Mucilaginibacter sp. X5P1]MBB6137940.1 hypothetical protein [Mucilaginibacter sp. X5P1]
MSSSITLEEAYGRIKMSSFHDERLISDDTFAIFKLNGSIKKIDKRKRHSKYLTDNPSFGYNQGFFESIFESYNALKLDPMKTIEENTSNELSFAWEHNLSYEFYENMKSSVYHTEVLVVIGYSFPFFNRKLDKLIINEYMPKLNKVYFQAPDAENLKERFLAITDRISYQNLFLRKDENQFTFPNELDI